MTGQRKGAEERRASVGFRPGVLLAALFAALLAISAVAPGAARAQSYVFNSVSIEGNSRIEAGTILSYAGIARGQSVSAGQLNDAYQRLINSGLFEAVDLVPSGSTLVIRVTEFPTISRINIEGNKRIKDDRLLALVKSQPRKIYSPAQARADADAIAKAYEATGRLAASVTPKIIRRTENRVDLVFEVSESDVVENERVSFVGNRDYSDARLRRVLGTKQAGIFRRLIQRDTYVPERIDFDKQVLRDFYLSRGYIDFRVDSVDTEFSRERDASFITFHVTEGQSYRYGRLTVVSEVPEANVADFEPQMKLRSGATYNPAAIDNIITRMETLAERKGLRFVRVDPQVTRRDAEGLLDIQFTLVRGPRVFVERIDIEGNETTLDRVIRNQFKTVEGDPFNPREIREAAERIRALGFFSNADVQAKQGTREDQVLVHVAVEEQNTGSLSFGGSYSPDSGAGLNVEFAESNFLGRGQGLDFRLTSGDGTSNFSFDFSDPNVLGRDLTFRLSAEWRETNNFNSRFSSRAGTVSPQLEFPISENGRLGVRYTFGYAEIYDVDNGIDANGFNVGDTNQNGVQDPGETFSTGSSKILKDEEALGGSFRSGIGYSYTYDTRTNGLNPKGGVVLRFSQDFVGLGGNTSYIKTTLRTAIERRVANDEVTLRAAFEGGALSMLEGSSLITDRFVLSSSTFRGFSYGGIGPRDLNVTNRDSLGGKYYAIARLEAEFPLGLPEEYGITGGAFLDVGTLWGLDNIMGGPNGTMPVDDSAHLRASVGVSVFWTTPIGPLRFNFSRPLVKEDYDETQSFDLTISTRF